MSMWADINQEFDDLIQKHPELKVDILKTKLGVYESLEWDMACDETEEEIKEAQHNNKKIK